VALYHHPQLFDFFFIVHKQSPISVAQSDKRCLYNIPLSPFISSVGM